MESQEPDSAGLRGMHVPDGFVIEPATAPGMVAYPMFATLDNQGRLFVIESSGETTSTKDVLENPDFKVLLLEDEDEDGIYDKRGVFADKIPYPMGGAFYDGSLYVTAPPDFIRFTDTDGDGAADRKEVLITGWTLNHNAATLSGPFFGPDGWMYMCDARRGFDITTNEGTQLKGKGARIWRCRPDGTDLEWVSGGGFDNSIEMIFMPSGETIGTMTYFTDPQDGFRDALMHWVEGGVYPKPDPVIEADGLKLTGDLMPVMTKLARVSPSGLMRYRSTAFGEAFRDNLFSAQFNTGRIIRHTITPEGGTFRTEDEVFLRSDSLDIHPTDILEDADGSLLVVNTGGWFIAGCPLSVVAKADVHGGIFRIRKTDAPIVTDPWGHGIDFETLSGETSTELLRDPRAAVRDNAVEHLVRLGDAAVGPLQNILRSPENEQARAAAVFALYRIQTPQAMNGVLAALDDQSYIVRAAAARVSGLAKEKKATAKLLELLKEDRGIVRRQAATALGQTGDPSAITPLLEAAATADDRIVEHAIIYSLITLGETAPLVQALKHPSENVRNAALIALDQIEGSPVRKTDLIAFLNSENTKLQNTGAWVLSHHREWTDMVIGYLRPALKKESLAETEKKNVSDLLITFSGDVRIQNFVAAALASPATPEGTKYLLLDVLGRYPTQALPEVWIAQLKTLLRGAHDGIRSKVLDVIQSRSISALDETLEQIFADGRDSKAFQLKALRARIMSQPKLSDKEFSRLLTLIRSGEEAPVQQSAMGILVQADLKDAQLLTLARETVPKAEVFLLPGLVSAFEGSKSAEVGRELISALQVSSDRMDYMTVHDLEKSFQTFPDAVVKAAQPLRDTLQARQATRLSALREFEISLRPGDVGEGRKLFFGKALCSTCHSVIGQGADFGPDLTNIGEIRSQHDLLEAVLYPSASFAREYETTKVVTSSSTHTGIIKEQLPETIAIETAPGILVRIPRKEITAMETQEMSLMPPGLHQLLTREEMSDLMAYLTSLPDGMGVKRNLEVP